MISAFDVHYENDAANVACVTFRSWTDAAPGAEYVSTITDVAPYESGSFYKRELPCLVKLIETSNLHPEIIIIDGYVWLEENKIGLGGHLYQYYGETIPVIGVAKAKFQLNTKVRRILRGNSQNPLYISSIGIELDEAVQNIESMHGQFRLPTLLKRVDQLCRGIS